MEKEKRYYENYLISHNTYHEFRKMYQRSLINNQTDQAEDKEQLIRSMVQVLGKKITKAGHFHLRFSSKFNSPRNRDSIQFENAKSFCKELQ